MQRLLLLVVISVSAVFMAMNGKIVYLIVASILSLFILWDYIQRNTVPIAMRNIYKNNYKAAESAIHHVNKIDRLNNHNKTHYFLAKGLIAHNQDQFEEANEYLEKALIMQPKNENDKAMALLALSDIAVIQKKISKAKDYFQQMNQLKVNKSLMPSIQQMQQFLASH